MKTPETSDRAAFFLCEAEARLKPLSPFVTTSIQAASHGTIVLDEIIASPMRQGHGSAAMRILTDLADETQLVMVLEIEDDDGHLDGLPSAQELVDFYQRFGFEEYGMSSRIRMRRKPTAKA